MKRHFLRVNFFIIFIVVALLLLTGYTIAAEPSVSKGPSATGPGERFIKLSLANSTASSSPASQTMHMMAKRMQELSKGSMEVKVYTDSQLGSGNSLIQSIQQGTVDMIATGDSYYSGLVPQIQVFELPFLFNSYESARAALDGPVGEKVKLLFNRKGIKPINFWEIGFRHITNNVRPIKEPNDLKGIKIRTLPAPVQVATWKLLGALPTPIDYGELYTALQQKVVDAQENPLNLIRAQKFYEIQRYLSLTGHVYSPQLFSVSQKTWDKLSENQRDVILIAGKEALARVRALVKESEAQDLDAIKSYGVLVEKNPNVAAFKKIAIQAYGVFTEKYGEELVKALLAAK